MLLIGQLFVVLLLLLCVAILIIGLPGDVFLFGIMVIYALSTGMETVTWSNLIVLALAAAVSQGGEFWLGYRVTEKSGASKGANIASIILAILLGIVFAPLFFGLGALLGALLGAWLGAFGYEFFTTRDIRQSLRSGYGALTGKVLGFTLKIGITVFMLVYSIQNIFWS
ncbi:DUF456 domain-containing protein [Chrysiogenes arsenatis]|uniref:DUF456 domain-containing protein n=1 Tax=Chrysiogenes arsenatis TaxID=309797 RepID=UPI00041246FE|nr:DUF456 domain-containing protein [Chrysiogenes arsenatis]